MIDRALRLSLELMAIALFGAAVSTILYVSFGWTDQMVATFGAYLSVLMLVWACLTGYLLYREDHPRHEPEGDIPELWDEAYGKQCMDSLGEYVEITELPKAHGRRAQRD